MKAERKHLQRLSEDPDYAAYVAEIETTVNASRQAARDRSAFADGEVRWYAVHTKALLEKAAHDELRRRGFFVFYPFRRQKVRRGIKRHLVDVERALFPRYLFVALRGRPQESFEAIEAVPPVSTIVRRRFCKEPLQIPNPVLDAVMQWVDSDGAMVEPEESAAGFDGKPGDSLRMVEDLPYNGLVARLARIDDLDAKQRITIWLDVLGGEREVSVPVSAVAEIIR